jgi:hypothetical protein
MPDNTKTGEKGAAGKGMAPTSINVGGLKLASAEKMAALNAPRKGGFGGGRGSSIEPRLRQVLNTPAQELNEKTNWYEFDHNSGAVSRQIKVLELKGLKVRVPPGQKKNKPCYVAHIIVEE